MVADVALERASQPGTRLPPGETGIDLRRTARFWRDALPLLLATSARYGPVFTLRIFHVNWVFMTSPEATHFVTVAGASKFRWRDGGMGELHPLLGDGLLAIDGETHHRARRAMVPAFHTRRVAATGETMIEESEATIERWWDGQRLDLYQRIRALALRIALRALFGVDPDSSEHRRLAEDFEQALSFWNRPPWEQMVRGPRTPWARLSSARARLDKLIYAEIGRHRRGAHSPYSLLAMLAEARDEEGRAFSNAQLRDHLVTLLFAGHDTTTSTIAFLFYELARHPYEADLLRDERDAQIGDRAVLPGELPSAQPRLGMAIDETLRLYPPAWIGPRRAIETFEYDEYVIPAGTPVNYCSLLTHRLPDVWPRPEAFCPARFAPEPRAQIPKGAYVPFGAGSRTCIGMRFGLLEAKAIATAILRRWRLVLEPGYRLRTRQMPTLSPLAGMPVTVRAR